MKVVITATPDELEALLQLARRAPMSLPESLFVEGVFSRWQREMIAAIHASQPNGNGTGVPADVLAAMSEPDAPTPAQSNSPPDAASRPQSAYPSESTA